MTTKQYLEEIRIMDIHTNNLISEKEQLFNMATSCTVPTDSEHVKSSPSGDKIDRLVVKIVQLEMDIAERIDAFIDIKNKIIRELEQIGDEKYYQLLYKRYVEYKDFSIISKEMNYSYKYIIELHGRALEQFKIPTQTDMSIWYNVGVEKNRVFNLH